jgi:hypothetical protein
MGPRGMWPPMRSRCMAIITGSITLMAMRAGKGAISRMVSRIHSAGPPDLACMRAFTLPQSESSSEPDDQPEPADAQVEPSGSEVQPERPGPPAGREGAGLEAGV